MTNNSTGEVINSNIDTNNSRKWWPLIALPIFFFLGWMSNDSLGASNNQNGSGECTVMNAQ